MSLEKNYYKTLSEEVNRLLIKASIDNAPVPIRQIASMCGANVITYDLGDEVSGVLVVDQKNWTIGVNSSNSRVRQRFTIAHELGHLLQHVDFNKPSKEFFVDKDFIVKFRSEKQYSEKEIKQEREANSFAAAILMPKDFIFRELKKPEYEGVSETRLIELLAKKFEVSVPAMTYRLADLNIFKY